MPNQQLIDYIKQQLERGVPANSIKEVLSKVGWNELDITQAFSNLNRMPVQAKKIMPQTINPIREEEGEERIVTERKPVYSNEIVYKPMGVEFISVLYFIISLIAFIFSGLSFFGINKYERLCDFGWYYIIINRDNRHLYVYRIMENEKLGKNNCNTYISYRINPNNLIHI